MTEEASHIFYLVESAFVSKMDISILFKLVLEKAEEPEIKLPTSAGSWKKQESSSKYIYFCFIDYAKAFDCVDQ